jgi:hypothetical protein
VQKNLGIEALVGFAMVLGLLVSTFSGGWLREINPFTLVATPLTAHRGCTGAWGGGGRGDVGVGEGPDADLPAMLPARYSVHSFTLEVEMTSLFAPIWPVSVKLSPCE